MSLQALLFTVGAVMEFAGIVLVGFPDFVPGALRLSSWLGVRARAFSNRLRRLVGLAPRRTVVRVSAAEEINVAARASVVKSVNPEATLDERVAFLVQRDEEAQRDINALRAQVAGIETEVPGQLEELRDRMEAHVAGEPTAAVAAYRPLRIAGTIALALGLTAVTIANFI